MRIPVDIRELIDVAEHGRRHQKQADQGKTETKIAIVQDNGQYRLPIDGLLAATAIHHNLTIVSRNVGDFANTQVPVVNPWEQ